MIELAASPVAAGVASDVSKLINIGHIDIAQMNDRPGFSAKGKVDISYPDGLPELLVDIGYFRVDNTIESTTLIGLELPNGLKFKPSSVGTDVNGAAVLPNDPQIAAKVQKFANALLRDRSVPSYAGMTGFRFGPSQQSSIQTFSKIHFDLSTTAILDVLEEMSNGSPDVSSMLVSLIPPGTVKIEGVDFAVGSSNDVSLKIQTTLTNPTKFSLNLGSMDVSSLLDDQTLSGIKVSPIKILPGTGAFNLDVSLKPSSGDNGMSNKVATIADAVLNHKFDINVIGGITGIKLTPEGGSSGAIINQLEPVKVELPVSDLLNVALNTKLPAASPLDLTAVLPSSDILSQLGPQIKFLQAIAQPNGKMSSGADFGYTNPLPLSAKVPYFAVSTSFNGMPAVDTEISSIQFERKSGNMQPRIILTFKNADGLPDVMATTVSDLLEGKIDTEIRVNGIYYGASANARSNLLSALDINATPLLQPFASYGTGIADILSQIATVNHLDKRQQSASGMLTISGPFGTSATLNDLALEFQPANVIGANVGASVVLPFPVDINIPYFSGAADLDDFSAGSFSSGIKASGATPSVQLNNLLTINDSDSLADKVAEITSAVLAGNDASGTVTGGRLCFGVSDSDNVKLFSKVGLVLGINKLIAPLKGMLGSSTVDPLVLIKQLGLKLGGLNIEAKPGKTISASAETGFTNPFKLSVKGLNYITASTGLNGNEIVHIQSPGLTGTAISSGSNNLKLDVDMVFQSSEEAKKAAADFANELSKKFGETEASFTASRMMFGYNHDNSFKFLSRAVLKVPSKSILNQKNLDLVIGGAGGLNATTILSLIEPKSLDVEFTQSKLINTDIKADLTVPFAVSLSVPFLDFGSVIDDVPLLNAEVLGTKISGQGKNSLALGTSVTLQETDEIADIVAAKVDAALENYETIPGTMGGGYLKFGVDKSPENVIDTFAQVAVSVPINLISKLVIQLMSFGKNPSIGAAIKSLELSIKRLQAKTLPGRVMQTELAAGFKSPFPISIKGLNYMTSVTGVDKTSIMMLEANGFSAVPGANNIELSTNIAFPPYENAMDKVASFVQNVLKDFGNTKEKLFATGIKFGSDKEHAHSIFKKVRMAIPSKWILNQENLDLILSSAGGIDIASYLSKLFLNKMHMSTIPSGEFLIDAIGGIHNVSFPATAEIGYVHAVTLLDRQP